MRASHAALGALGASLASVVGAWVALVATRAPGGVDALWGGFPARFRGAFLASASLAYALNAALVAWVALSGRAPEAAKWAVAAATLGYYSLAALCAPLLAWAVAGGAPAARRRAVRALLAVAVLPMALVALVASRHPLAGEDATPGLGALKGALALLPLAHVLVGDALLFSALL